MTALQRRIAAAFRSGPIFRAITIGRHGSPRFGTWSNAPVPLVLHHWDRQCAGVLELLQSRMHTFFASVKNRSASTPPSRPTPLCFMPPKGVRRSRTIQQFTHTIPDSSR